jgi:hypothetical protein
LDNKAPKDKKTIITWRTNNAASKEAMSIIDYDKEKPLKFTVCFCNYKVAVLLSRSEQFRRNEARN